MKVESYGTVHPQWHWAQMPAAHSLLLVAQLSDNNVHYLDLLTVPGRKHNQHEKNVSEEYDLKVVKAVVVF